MKKYYELSLNWIATMQRNFQGKNASLEEHSCVRSSNFVLPVIVHIVWKLSHVEECYFAKEKVFWWSLLQSFIFLNLRARLVCEIQEMWEILWRPTRQNTSKKKSLAKMSSHVERGQLHAVIQLQRARPYSGHKSVFLIKETLDCYLGMQRNCSKSDFHKYFWFVFRGTDLLSVFYMIYCRNFWS